MTAPARAGLFIYASHVDRVARFYESVLGMTRAHETSELVVLRSPDMQIVVHAIPPGIAAAVNDPSSAAPRDGAAFKFFFTVPSLPDAEATAESHGGRLLPGQWSGRGFIVRNAVDPEGNIFHLRELTG